MADETSTSVGKISLQVDLDGDMQKQISEMAGTLGESLKSSLEKSATGMASGLEKAISTTMKNINTSLSELTNGFGESLKASLEKASGGMFTELEKVIDSAMTNINTSISDGLAKMKTQMESFVESIRELTKKIKVPRKMPLSTNVIPAMNPVIPTAMPRGPPMAAPKMPAINSETIQAEISKVSQHLDLVNQKIELQQAKLVGLRESYERALNPNIKNKLAMQINSTELGIMKLTEASDKMGFKLNDLDSKMGGTAQAANKLGASVKVATDKIKQSASKATQNMTPLGKASEVVGSKFDKMGRMINSAFKRVLIMGTLYKVIHGFMSYMGSAMATNQQFANSLAIVKSNLQVAFIPIFNAILPALNMMMSALATATAYLASFFSILGGSSFKASTASAKALNTQKAAIAGVGAASKKTAKEVQKSLAGFDEITNLSTPEAEDAGGGGGGGASGIAPIVSPGLDTSEMENSIKAFLDKLAPYFEPIKAALGRLKEAFEPLKENIFAGLKWFMDNILIPLGTWTITEVVPRFIDILSNAIKILNGVIEALAPLFKWLWDKMLKPLAEWTGGIIVSVLDAINGALSTFGDWIADNKGLIEALAIIVGSIAVAWGLVNGAMAIWNVVAGIGALITGGLSAAVTILGAAIAFITSPIGIAIAAIAAIIAIGILLWKNWDKVSAWLARTWEGIRTAASNIWGGIGDTIKGVFDGVMTFIGGIIDKIQKKFTEIFGVKIGESVGAAFRGVINSVLGSVERTINGFIRMINNAIWIINKIPGVNIGNIKELSIPRLATGGMIEQPTLAIVGEAGREAVLPIDRDRGAMEQIANMLMDKMGGGDGGGDYETSAEVDGDVLFKIVMKRLNKRRRQKNLPIIEF